jgi:hypothetical protein
VRWPKRAVINAVIAGHHQRRLRHVLVPKLIRHVSLLGGAVRQCLAAVLYLEEGILRRWPASQVAVVQKVSRTVTNQRIIARAISGEVCQYFLACLIQGIFQPIIVTGMEAASN